MEVGVQVHLGDDRSLGGNEGEEEKVKGQVEDIGERQGGGEEEATVAEAQVPKEGEVEKDVENKKER